MSNIDDCVEMKLAADTQTQAPGATIKPKHWLCVCIYMHTRAHTRAHAHGGFGVQRMFYFGNSFGLVTLPWWQTEKQVANIKHFTSTATCSNTHANTQTRTHTDSHSRSPCISFFSLSLNSEKHLAKGRMCCFKLASLLLLHQQLMYDHSSSDSFVKNTTKLCSGSLKHNAQWQDAGIRADEVVIWPVHSG